MLVFQWKRFMVCLMAVLSVLCAAGRGKTADSYSGHDFPIVAAKAQNRGTTRIMSFNIRCADVNGVPVKDRRNVVVRQILEIMPDSLGVQEATAEWMKTLRRLPQYGWVGLERDEGKPADQGGESCPIFYLKAKYRALDHGDFWLSETPETPSFGPGAACRRICTWVKLRNRLTGEIFFHVNSHLDHVSEEARVFGAHQIIRFIEETCAGAPVFFTADMNTTEDKEAVAIMTQTLKNTRTEAADCAGFTTFHGANPETHRGGAIDFILCSEDVAVQTYRTVTKGVDGRFVSDHFPIYADVKFSGGRKPAC